jgi:hypothetical protein
MVKQIKMKKFLLLIPRLQDYRLPKLIQHGMGKMCRGTSSMMD